MKHLFHSDRRSTAEHTLPSTTTRAKAGKRRFLKCLGLGLATVAAVALLQSPAIEAQALPWMNTALTPEQRTSLLLAAMTQADKYAQMIGAPGVIAELPQCYGGRHIPGIPRLAIPTFRITNGPVGIGQGDCVPPSTPGLPISALTGTATPKATALPSAIGLAASFDPATAAQFGNLMAVEANNLALQLVEGPGMNMARVSQGGRNFEYLGEDPFLTGSTAVAEIKAIQAQGVLSMAKHIVANEQETNRMTINEIIDDRVLHELYLLPFEMAVKDGGVSSIMCSYNSVNGVQMCQNKYVLTDTLRTSWGFNGFVQSDFFANHSLAASLTAGLDLEMPGINLGFPGYIPWYTPAGFTAALAAGQIQQSNIDNALTRRFVPMFRLGVFDRPLALTPIDVTGDGAIAEHIGEQMAVLLKNSNAALPINLTGVHSVAIIGKADYASKAVSGCCGGSSDVIPFYTVTPLQGVQNALAALGSNATATLTIVADDNSDLAVAASTATASDVVIIIAGAISEEGADQPSMSLPKGQDAMIAAIAAANPRAVVVLKDNAAVLMPWINSVPAVMETWFPGQEDGNIVARLVFGLANPSGKTPVTYPVLATDGPIQSTAQFPGVSVGGVPTVTYSEGLKMGYRWYDSQGIQPLFPFGFGLSYTTFAMSNLTVTPKVSDGTQPITIQFTLQNTGARAGAEVPQLYLGMPPQIGEPPKRLVAFQKVWLNPGESTKVQLTIDPAATNHPLSYWDENNNNWSIANGFYPIYVGNSSRDIAVSGTIMVRHN
jgi:beta-glucosidase